MNILFLTDSALTKICRGGIERSTENCAREMARRGNGVFILAWSRKGTDFSDAFPQSVFPDEKPRASKKNRALFEKILCENEIDVIIFQCGGGWYFPFPREAKNAGVPVVSVVHNVPDSYVARYKMKYSGLSRVWNTWAKFWWQKRKFRFNFDRCACTVLLSEGLIPSLEKHLTPRQIAAGKIEIIPNFAPPFGAGTPALSAKKRELLFVGRMSFEEKRPDLLLRVWAKISPRFPEWTLRFVGDGNYLPKLKESAGTIGGGAQISFEGFQKPEKFYRDAAIFCMTSAYESFGNVLVEAAAFGCVPVAFDSFSAVRDIISDGENGVLVPAFDCEKYAEKLAGLMENSALRERLAKNTLAIPEKFSPEKIGDRWEKLLRRCVARSTKF